MALGRHVEGLGLDRHEEPADGAHRHVEDSRLRALQVLEEPRRPAADMGVEEAALLSAIGRRAEASADAAGHHPAARGDVVFRLLHVVGAGAARLDAHPYALPSLIRISYA